MLTKALITLKVLTAEMQREAGQGLAEYALIIVLVSIAVVAALGFVGDEITSVFTTIQTQLSNTGG